MPSSSIGTRQHTSLAAAIVVQQLLGLVDGGEFLGSDLPAVLPFGRRTEVHLGSRSRNLLLLRFGHSRMFFLCLETKGSWLHV